MDCILPEEADVVSDCCMEPFLGALMEVERALAKPAAIRLWESWGIELILE